MRSRPTSNRHSQSRWTPDDDHSAFSWLLRSIPTTPVFCLVRHSLNGVNPPWSRADGHAETTAVVTGARTRWDCNAGCLKGMKRTQALLHLKTPAHADNARRLAAALAADPPPRPLDTSLAASVSTRPTSPVSRNPTERLFYQLTWDKSARPCSHGLSRRTVSSRQPSSLGGRQLLLHAHGDVCPSRSRRLGSARRVQRPSHGSQHLRQPGLGRGAGPTDWSVISVPHFLLPAQHDLQLCSSRRVLQGDCPLSRLSTRRSSRVRAKRYATLIAVHAALK